MSSALKSLKDSITTVARSLVVIVFETLEFVKLPSGFAREFLKDFLYLRWEFL